MFFPLSTQVSPVSHVASTTLVRFLALLRLSSALPDPIVVPVPVHIIAPFLISANALVSVPAPVPVPILCPSTGLHPRPRSCSRPVPAPVPAPILRFFVRLHPLSRSRSRSIPVPVPAPDSDTAPGPVRFFPSLGPCYSLDAVRVYRYQALRTELSGARKRCPLSADMMTRAE